MSAFIIEDVLVIENNFSADSRDKEGVRIVSFDAKRTLALHIAVAHIVHIEAVTDAKSGDARGIVFLSSGQRFITRRSADDLYDAIKKAG